MSELGKLSISVKPVMSTFRWHKSCIILGFDYETASFGIRAAGVIYFLVVHFPVLVLGNSGMLLTSRDNQLLGKFIIFKKLSDFWKLME